MYLMYFLQHVLQPGVELNLNLNLICHLLFLCLTSDNMNYYQTDIWKTAEEDEKEAKNVKISVTGSVLLSLFCVNQSDASTNQMF